MLIKTKMTDKSVDQLHPYGQLVNCFPHKIVFSFVGERGELRKTPYHYLHLAFEHRQKAWFADHNLRLKRDYILCAYALGFKDPKQQLLMAWAFENEVLK